MTQKHASNKTGKLCLLTVSGEDHIGISCALTEVLARFNVNILDIGQAVIHNTLSMGFLIELQEATTYEFVFKDILFQAYAMQLVAKFEPITMDEYHNWVNQRGKNRYILTLMSRKITSEHLARITRLLFDHALNIESIHRLSGRVPLESSEAHHPACFELTVKGTPTDANLLKASFLNTTQELGIDIAFQEDTLFRKSRRLVCFDMDSTLIQVEVIVELARIAGVGDEVHQITEAAMRGEIDFAKSFVERVALLKGIDESVMQSICEHLPLTEGTEKLIKTLKFFGYKTAILSGGFTYFGHYLQKKLGIDYVFANQLEIVQGKLTGRHQGPIIDGPAKAHYLRQIAKLEQLNLQQVIAVGDGANDLPMLAIAGLGIAFQAKPIVRSQAAHSISTLGLDSILYMLGYRDQEIQPA